MVTVFEECTTEGQRSVVRFCGEKGPNGMDIQKELFPAYGG
jgi:hypothetical protein